MPNSNDSRGPSNPVEQHKELDPHTLKALQTPSKDIQASHIKALLQNKGKITLDGKELILKDPSPTDPRLLEMVDEPTLSVEPVSTPPEKGDCEYDLKSIGRKVRIKIAFHKIK